MIKDYLALSDALFALQARPDPEGNYVTMKLATWECEALERLLQVLVGDMQHEDGENE